MGDRATSMHIPPFSSLQLYRRRPLLTAALGSWLLAGLPARAAAFPERPLNLTVPFPAGGATDLLMRGLAALAGRELGQTIVVDNKPGAAGVLGAQQLVRARPDGYTLAVLPEPVFRLPHLQKMAYDPRRDFSYVIQLAGYALGVAVRQDAPWHDWETLVADARQRPGHIMYGSTGTHGTMHMTMEEISRRLGVSFFHVPYKGEGEITTALLGGHIDLGITAGSIAPLVEQGQARMLAVWTAARVPRWPGVPTLRELGLDLVANAPIGIAGPRGLPAAVLQRLQGAFQRALQTPQARDLMQRLNMEPAYLGATAYAQAAQERYAAARLQLLRLGLPVQQR
jgi:tripartite-type tricarboxylate transporter receptor subunit TctC